MLFETSISNEGKKKITVNPQTNSGKPAVIDGALQVAVVEGNGTVVQDPAEPLSFYCVSADSEGLTRVSVKADRKIGDAVELIEEEGTFNTTLAEAANFGNVVVGAEEPK